jgi:predicted Zn-dependent peptidase
MVAREVLLNGLVVLVDERPSADTLAFQLNARAGSRDDGPTPGITVLTSRLMFQGTRRRPTETDLQRAAAAVGGSVSRATSNELSDFLALLPAGEAGVGFDLLADLVIDPLLADDALARQVQIATQELSRQRSDPGGLLGDLYLSHVFAGHPLGTPLLGTAESLAALSPAALRAHRQRLWGASNLVLAVAGRISAAEAVGRARDAFGVLPAGAPNVRPAQAPAGLDGSAVSETAGQQQAQFRLGFLAPDQGSDDRFAFRVLNALTAGSSGRLFEAVRNARGLAYTATSSYNAYSDAGTWFATAGVDPQNLQPALDVVRAEVQRLVTAPPEGAEVALRIGQLAGQQILSGESNAARAGRLVAQEVLGTETQEELLRRLREVGPEDVWRVARDYLQAGGSLLATVRPPESPGATP